MSNLNYQNQVTSSQILANLVKENTCVIIKISASWCGPCKDSKFLKLYSDLKNNFSQYQNIKFVELDIDKDSSIIEDTKYYDIKVNSVPTFLVSQNGHFIKKFEGNGKLNEINQIIINSLK